MPRARIPVLVAALAALPLALLAAGCAAPAAAEPAPLERELTVGFAVVDGVYGTELTAPHDVFHHTVFHVPRGMRVLLVGPSLEPVTTFEGLRLLPDHTFADAPPLDVLVVPSAEHNLGSDLEDEAYVGYVRRAGAEARYVLSLCDGAFVLAAAGLLDGHEATTFPADQQELQRRFPRVLVRSAPSFVHDGRVVTSQGGARSFDAALYLCERLYGAQAARGIARGLVLDWDLAEVPHRVAP